MGNERSERRYYHCTLYYTHPTSTSIWLPLCGVWSDGESEVPKFENGTHILSEISWSVEAAAIMATVLVLHDTNSQ
ncbi:unnamed protein product [Sphenostylis stenocarpa]|uniref:Uncharacterized protein n=1 Tax=Sphenostylis stenocarpa TaxID=92480 RepID=A0AA86S0P3_9FABA|nr:unnamed protein product [Sphenostylis stenocarpa]